MALAFEPRVAESAAAVHSVKAQVDFEPIAGTDTGRSFLSFRVTDSL